MRKFEEVNQQTAEAGVPEVENDTIATDEIIAMELGDTMRLEVLKLPGRNPFTKPSKAWLYTALSLIFLMLIVGGIRYFGYRVDNVIDLQREETVALRNELESKQSMIDELNEVVRQQARAQQAITAAAPAAGDESAIASIPVAKSDTVSISAQPTDLEPRAPLPASLEPGEVLLIVASTPFRQEALDLALTLEHDSHASEVVLGLTGYYGVALGRFEFEQAEQLRISMVESAPDNPAPYLMPDALIDSYVYP